MNIRWSWASLTVGWLLTWPVALDEPLSYVWTRPVPLVPETLLIATGGLGCLLLLVGVVGVVTGRLRSRPPADEVYGASAVRWTGWCALILGGWAALLCVPLGVTVTMFQFIDCDAWCGFGQALLLAALMGVAGANLLLGLALLWLARRQTAVSPTRMSVSG